MNVQSVRTEFVEFEDYKPEARFSSLHPLELIGSGTGNVECLASYVWRVADSSSLTPNLVCRKVIAPLGRLCTTAQISDNVTTDPRSVV